MNKIYILPMVFLLLFTCKNQEQQNGKKPLAKVFDKYLYYEDIEDIFNEEMSAADSAAKMDSYINNWVKKELFIKKAELNLVEEEKNFRKMIEEYRADLLIHSYEQKLIEQKLDTNINETQIREFYEKSSSQFLLNFNAVKVLFIKIGSDVKENYKVRYLYRSDKESDLQKLEKICRENSATFDNFSGEWIRFSEILEYLPEKPEHQQEFLKYKKHIEAKDSLYNYYIKIYDYKLIGEVSPLKFVRSNMRTIILNQRKHRLTSEIEKTMYQNALNNGNVEVF